MSKNCIKFKNIVCFKPTFTPLVLHEKPEEKHYTLFKITPSFLVKNLVQNTQKLSESQRAWVVLTHRQCLSANGRRKNLLYVYLYFRNTMCAFPIHWGFWGEIWAPINDFNKSEEPAGPSERCLLAISWITSFIWKYDPDCMSINWLLSEDRHFLISQ